jgi:hypothetical protein
MGRQSVTSQWTYRGRGRQALALLRDGRRRNSLFKPLVDNLRIVPGQWITDPPVVHAPVGSQPNASDAELADVVRTELNEAAARARKPLSLGRVRTPEKLAPAIHAARNCISKRSHPRIGVKTQIGMSPLCASQNAPAIDQRCCILATPFAARQRLLASLSCPT